MIRIVRNVIESVKNLKTYTAVVWNHRWWDYGFQLDMIDKMLEDCENNWVKRTHYVGDKFTLGRIKVVRRYYKEYKEEVCYEEEDKKMMKFMKAYTRLLKRLWD